MNTAEKIISLRAEKGISQQELADAVFVSRSLVSMWETGSRVPDSLSVEKMAALFNVREEEILSDRKYAFASSLERKLIDEEIAEFTDAGSSPGNKEQAKRIMKGFLNSLGGVDRELFMSRYFSMKTCKAISEELQMNVSTVRGRLSKLRKKLIVFAQKEEKNER
ncbi:MAG: helix-turn-helix domain-containing protein [Clostridia bacterium]|nr:helix-turn-helix domain-containing protein [Clostridia bacterium]